MCTSAAEIRSTISSGGQYCLVCSEPMKSPVFHIERDDTDAFSTIHDQVESEVFDEKGSVVSQRLAVKSVKNSMTRTVCCGCASIGLAAFAIF